MRNGTPGAGQTWRCEGVGAVASPLVPVRVGDIEVEVEVESGLKSVSGGVIMAGVAGEASLKVTLGYDVAARPVTGGSSGAAAGTALGGHAVEPPGGAA